MIEDGLFYPDGTFKTKEEVIRDSVRDGSKVIFHTDSPEPKSFEWWHTRVLEAQAVRMETLLIPMPDTIYETNLA